MLNESYEALMKVFPSYKSQLTKDWKIFDSEIFKFPDTVGKCGFISQFQDNFIGFASWDPRQGPKLGVVGHNCILPRYRGEFHGKAQIYEVIRILKVQKFLSVNVTTGDHPFFTPAQKMYVSCGFTENRRFKDSSNPFFGEIEYSMKL